MPNVRTLFWDNGGVILTNGWDRGSRQKAVAKFHLDWTDFEDRHELMLNAFECGQASLDEYLRRVVFYQERPFAPDEFKQFMFQQSQACPEALAFLGELARTRRYLNAHAEATNRSRLTNTEYTHSICGIISRCFSVRAIWEHASRIGEFMPWR